MCTASFQRIDLQFLEVEQVVIEMSDCNAETRLRLLLVAKAVQI